MKRFSITQQIQPLPNYRIWFDRIASAIGGLAIITIAILAFPFTIFLFFWIKFKPAVSINTPSFPKHDWETLVSHPAISIEKLVNDDLLQADNLPPAIIHDLEVNEFVAYSLKATPDLESLHQKFFDFSMIEALNGLFLIEINPLDEQQAKQLTFLDFMTKNIISIQQLPGNYAWSFKLIDPKQVLLQGENDKHFFNLTIEQENN